MEIEGSYPFSQVHEEGFWEQDLARLKAWEHGQLSSAVFTDQGDRVKIHKSVPLVRHFKKVD